MANPRARVRVGDVFGALTVIEVDVEKTPGARGAIARGRLVRVRCECGSIRNVRATNLRATGGTRSCSTFCPSRYQRVADA